MPVSVNQSFSSFIEFLQFEKRYSANTIISYNTDLSDFFDYLKANFGDVELNDINHNFIRSWLASLKSKGLGAKSINRKISSLKSFFKYQLKTETIEISPMGRVISPKVGKRLPVFVKESETKNLVELLNNTNEDWKTLNAKMLISIFYATGMRLSELINLKEDQVDFSRSQIKVLGKGSKERVIPVGQNIADMIKEYQQLKRKEFEKSENVLLVTEKGKKIYPKYAYLLVNKYLTQASTLEKKSPHVLRHTFATHLMNNGADLNAVKELLGHTSLASTQIYTHNTIEKLKDVHKKAHPKS
ncbi:MAG: tyrosine-type recombinase/integrase [Chitinophagaceae bacterium]